MTVCQVLELSTSHMPMDREDYDVLDGDFGEHRAVEHSSGWVIFTALESPAEQAEMLVETPEWLHPILKLAWAEGCSYINFDKDAAVTQLLPIYDGEETLDTEEI